MYLGWSVSCDSRATVEVHKVRMSLRAVVCIRSAHYVTYACVPGKSGGGWVFYDSMAENQLSADGCDWECIPSTRACPQVGFVSEGSLIMGTQ